MIHTAEPVMHLSKKEIEEKFIGVPELSKTLGITARQLDYLNRTGRFDPTHYTWSNLMKNAPVWEWTSEDEAVIGSGYRRLWERGSQPVRFAWVVFGWIRIGMEHNTAVELATHQVYRTELPERLEPLEDVRLSEGNAE